MNPATQSYFDKLMSDRTDYMDDLKRFRRYTEGDSDQVLSRKQIKLLKPDGGELHYKLNVCDTIVTTETDRLKLRGVTMAIPRSVGNQVGPRTQAIQDLNALIATWFKQSRIDIQSKGTHYASARDGDSYVIVEPHAVNTTYKRPKLTFHEAYDGETGVDMVYLNNDPSHPLYATKVWIAEIKNENGLRIIRRNTYLPDRVLKEVTEGAVGAGTAAAGWQPYTANGKLEVIDAVLNGATFKAGVEWWTDTKKEGGNPLGIPVFHFAHNPNGGAYGRSTLADVVPDLQDRLNRAAAVLEYATLFAGFNVHILTGWEAADDANNPDTSANSVPQKLEAVPGMMYRNSSENAGAITLSATNLEQLIRVKESALRDVAMVSKTPLPMLNPSGDVAAEGTLQQMEAPLLAKVTTAQTVFGNAWEDVARMMLVIESVFGEKIGLTLEEITELDLSAEWDDAQTRNESIEISNATQKRTLGIPDKQLWKELGYTPDEIQAFETDAQVKRNVIIAGLTETVQQLETQNNANTNNGANSTTSTNGSNNGVVTVGSDSGGGMAVV